MLLWRQNYAVLLQSEKQILQLKRQLTSKLWILQGRHETLAVEAAANMQSQLHDNCIIIFKENMQLSKMPVRPSPIWRQLHHYLLPEQHLKIRDAALAAKLCSSDAVRAANLAVLAATRHKTHAVEAVQTCRHNCILIFIKKKLAVVKAFTSVCLLYTSDAADE